MSDEVIFEYTDEQALADGLLVEFNHGNIDRVTRAVFDKYVWRKPAFVQGRKTERLDFRPLKRIAQLAMGEIELEAWEVHKQRKVTILENGNERLFCMKNERGKFTLMFPEDY